MSTHLLEFQLPNMLVLAAFTYSVLPRKLPSGKLKQWLLMSGISTSNATAHTGLSKEFQSLIWGSAWQPRVAQLITYHGNVWLLVRWFVFFFLKKMPITFEFSNPYTDINSIFKLKATFKEKNKMGLGVQRLCCRCWWREELKEEMTETETWRWWRGPWILLHSLAGRWTVHKLSAVLKHLSHTQQW